MHSKFTTWMLKNLMNSFSFSVLSTLEARAYGDIIRFRPLMVARVRETLQGKFSRKVRNQNRSSAVRSRTEDGGRNGQRGPVTGLRPKGSESYCRFN